MTIEQNGARGDNWALHNADCVEVLRALPPSSVDLTIFSPPYLSLYTYSASPRDIGNCTSDDQFWGHFGFVMDELRRVTKPGRIVAVDVMNVPAMKERDGYIGLKDFRGDVIHQFVKRGFIFHSEHCMWKDPLIEATRTKALGLMHKQLCKDSAMSRAGIPQYLLAFRAPGVNPEPVTHANGLEVFYGEDEPTMGKNLSHDRWRRYASPVWMDINFTRTLNYRSARETADEKHVCPFALDIVERAVHLWSNPGDIVLDPFTGVGSTGHVALQMGRRFVGAELKRSYYEQAARNLAAAAQGDPQSSLFDIEPAVDVEPADEDAA
jgi:DNA modification methylase